MSADANAAARLPAEPVVLHPHPGTPDQDKPLVPWAGQVQVRMALGGSPNGPGILLQFDLAGDVESLAWPEPAEGAHTDGLWQHTCMEAFVGLADEPVYHEFNFAPSGEWAVYAFASERVRADTSSESGLRRVHPVVESWRHPDRATVIAWLPMAALPPHAALQDLRWNFTAVLETTTGTISYWALTHPAERPDFHHPAGRIWQLPALGN